MASALSGITFFLASFAIAGNIGIVGYFQVRIKTKDAILTRLLLLLHIAAVFESIASLPEVYTGNRGCCNAMGAFHYYFGLVIFSVVVCLSILCFNYLYINSPLLEQRFSSYAVSSIILFSCITFLPLTTDSYGINNEVWCSVDYHQQGANIWAFFVFYLWAGIAWVISLAIVIYVQTFASNALPGGLFSTIAGYILVSLFSIIPRIFPRMINLFVNLNISFNAQYFVQGGIYISTVLYVFCFLRSREVIEEYEKRKQTERASMAPIPPIALIDLITWAANRSETSSVSSSKKSGKDVLLRYDVTGKQHLQSRLRPMSTSRHSSSRYTPIGSPGSPLPPENKFNDQV